MEPATWPAPKRLTSHVFELTDEQLMDRMGDSVGELTAKLAAENERMLRLLPDPPHGYRWEGEVEINTEDIARDMIKARVVYRSKRNI